MRNRRKILLISMIAILLFIGFYLSAQKAQKPRTQSETVNDVITIIQELEKDSKKSK